MKNSIILQKINFGQITAALAYVVCCLIGFIILPIDFKETYSYYMTTISLGLLLILFSEKLSYNKLTSRIFYVLGFLIISSIFALRAQTGIDDFQYEIIFNKAGIFSFKEYMTRVENEKGYLLLNYILYKMTNGNYNLTQVIISEITFFFWGKGIWDKRKFVSISMATFLFVTNYYFLIMAAGLVRIFLASGIVFWGYKYIKKDMKKYVFSVIFASFFHRSALMMLIFIVVKYKKDFIYKYWKRFVFLIALILPIAFYFVIKILVPILGYRYSGYSITIESLSLTAFIDILPVLIIGLVLEKQYLTNNRFEYSMCMILISMSCLIQIYSMFGLGRTVYYTNIGIILLFASIGVIKREKSILEHILPMFIVIYGYIYMFHTSFLNMSNSGNLFPYYSMSKVIENMMK